MMRFAAPEILDPTVAGQLGIYLSHIFETKDRTDTDVSILARDFLQNFDMPEAGEGGISRGTFERELASFLGREGSLRALDVFEKSGLLKRSLGRTDRYSPTCRLNRCRNQDGDVFVCTDSAVADLRERVFPWVDEGEVIAAGIIEAWRSSSPERILDVGAGAGTVGMLLGKRWPTSEIIGVDNSPRAKLYADFNAQLNGIKRYHFVEHDLILKGSLSHSLGDSGFDIIAIDPPFTSMPEKIGGFSHSNIARVLEAGLQYGIEQVRPQGLAALLCYSFGNEKEPTQLHKVLEAMDLTEFKHVEIEHVDRPIWRLFGEKRTPLNPMPVQYMAPRYFDPDWRSQFDEAKYTYPDYVRWIENTYARRGMTHLHYLLVTFSKRSP